MIIQIRGTSGSGKSTVMRDVIDSIAPLDRWEAQYVIGRRKPESYRHDNIYVLGHYESPCGGCDNIGSARKVFELIERILPHAPKNPVILCEGLLLSEDVKWSSQLDDLRVVFLTTPIDECLERIVQRRKSVGNDKPLNPNNTTNRVAVIERARIKLETTNAVCRRASSTQAHKVIQRWLQENR